jgi:hypothetical protein
VAEMEYQEAERLCYELLRSDYESPESSLLKGCQLTAVTSLLNGMTFRLDMSKTAKQAWLDGFVAQAGDVSWLANDIALARRQIGRIDEMIVAFPTDDESVSAWRLTMLVSNVMLIIVFTGLCVRKRMIHVADAARHPT